MITLPLKFDELRHRRATGACFLVRFWDATSSSYRFYAEKTLALSNVRAAGYVTGVSPITHSIDYVTANYKPLHVTVLMVGQPAIKKTTGEWTNLLDELEGVWGKDIDIYWWPGGHANHSGDALLIFSGTVMDMQLREDEVLEIQADERERLGHRSLPQRKADVSVFADIPADRRSIYMPIVYGRFYEGTAADPIQRVHGGAIAEPISTGSLGSIKYLVSDHPLKELSQMAFYISKLSAWAFVQSGVTYNANDTTSVAYGQGTMTLQFSSFRYYVYLPPSIGGANAADYDVTTLVPIVAVSSTRAEVEFGWMQSGSSVEEQVDNGVAAFEDSLAGRQVCQVYKSVTGGGVSSHAVDVWTGAVWVQISTATTQNLFYDADFFGHYNFYDPTEGVFWHLSDGPKGDTTEQPFRVRVRLEGSGFTVGATLGYVHAIRLRLYCSHVANYPISDLRGDMSRRNTGDTEGKSRRRGGVRGHAVPNSGGDVFYNSFMAEPPLVRRHSSSRDKGPMWELDGNVVAICKGRMYGAWIDVGGRSNPFNEGDDIRNEIGIIESILRDELGLGDTEIDWAAFDICYRNLVWNSTTITDPLVNLAAGQTVDSQTLIHSLCAETGLWVFWSGNGRVSLHDPYLSNSVYPNRATIRWDDITPPPRLGFTAPEDLVNEMTFHFGGVSTAPRGWSQTLDVSSAASQADYGVRKGEMNLRYRGRNDGTPYYRDITRPMAYFCDDPPGGGGFGWYSRRRRIVTFTAIGLKHAALDLGDRIGFDDEFNRLLPLPDGNWTTYQFLIFRKQITQDAITFKAIQR